MHIFGKPDRRRQSGTRRPGRPGVSNLPPPNRRFDVALTPNFEGAQNEEDRLRARMLRRQAKRDPTNGRALLALASRIDPEEARNPKTLASSRYMRGLRIRIVSALWQLIYEA